MDRQFLQTLERERVRLEHSLAVVNRLIELQKEEKPQFSEQLNHVFMASQAVSRPLGFPFYGSLTEKIGWAVLQIGKFCRKEEVYQLLLDQQPNESLKNVPSVLSRMVQQGRLVSLKFNRSNLYVFYGSPSFVNFEAGEINKDRKPGKESLANLRVKELFMSCGGEQIEKFV